MVVVIHLKVNNRCFSYTEVCVVVLFAYYL